jgi:hypothetical protein
MVVFHMAGLALVLTGSCAILPELQVSGTWLRSQGTLEDVIASARWRRDT